MLLVIKLFLIGFIVPGAWAAKKDRFPTPSQPPSQLLIESEKLKVLEEAGVQKPRDPSRRLYGVSLAQMKAKRLDVFANDRTVSYQTDRQSAIGAELSYLPILFYGYWGIHGGVHYTYMEGTGPVVTSLHWISSQASLAYRYEASEAAYIKPFFALGIGSEVIVQRGPSYYNTSEARTVSQGSLGANLNLSRLFNLQSPLIWELSARYRRVVGPDGDKLNFNGHHYALGMELAL